MAAIKRVIPLGVNYGISLTKLQGINNVAINVPAASLLVNRSQCKADGYNFKFYSSFSSKSYAHNKFHYRQISQLVKSNNKRAFLVDTLALVHRFEAQGVPSKQAEAITSAITESDLVQEANHSKFKSQVQSSQAIIGDSMESHISLLQHKTEKLRNDIEKVRSELRYEIDKLTAGQRLDLNLERGFIRDELAKQNTETSNLTNKLDREIHALRAQLEAGKYEVIKYCIGTLVSISAVGLAVLRLYA
ncbi:hypothetical protein RND71_015859 [Anisodus tanguticus]|uniref:Protein FMP32, mitochondrial n=1 Tax=Anisodus tanguticus TaxID=243964 RepID=A0AAE1S728_9SOLA|nr:hypothetical protein RND71_015859 [Anisodus tanguticus]